MTVTTARHRATFTYLSHHSAHHSSHLHHAPQHTKRSTPRCTTQLHHAPQRTTIHPKLHHAPQRTNTMHPTAPRSGSPDPETPDAPGVLVLKAEAVAHCGYLAPMVQVKKQIPFGCCLLHRLNDILGVVDCYIHLCILNFLTCTCAGE